MNKNLCLFVFLALLLTVVPANVFAAEDVTINLISDKSPGDMVTISGQSNFSEVNIKILYPNKSVYNIETVPCVNGSYNYSFTLREDLPFGIYTVIAGMGSTVANTTFEVKEPETTPSPAPTPGSGPEEDDDNVNYNYTGSNSTPGKKTENNIVKGQTVVNGSTAETKFTLNALARALDSVKPDEDGIKTVQLIVEEVEGVSEYVQVLSAEIFSADGRDEEYGKNRLEIVTAIGTLTLQNNMFKNGQIKDAKEVRISIGLADISDLDDELKSAIGDKPVLAIKVFVDGEAISWENKDVPVTFSMDYIPTEKEMENLDSIVVWYIDSEGNVTSVPNGRYNYKNGKVIFTTTHFSRYAFAYCLRTFTDSDNHPWAKKEIEFAASKGIMKGVSENIFGPEVNPTRAEFVDALVKTLGLYAEFDTTFEDIETTDYYYESVGIARKLGITTGVGSNKFNPDAVITRKEMATLVYRALNVAEKAVAEGNISDLEKFNDAGDIPAYAIKAMASLVKEGIIIGTGKGIEPNGLITKAQTAVLMYRLYKLNFN